MTLKRFKAGLLLIPIGLWCAAPAHAALGGGPASVGVDAAALPGVDHITPLQQYDIHEIAADNGMVIREFMTRGGVVFAVTWTGPAMPDVKALLGDQFPAYTAAIGELPRRGPHRSLRIATSTLVVETGGHMRAYSGRAYLPAMIPTGTPISDLR